MSKQQKVLKNILSKTLYNTRMKYNDTQNTFSERCGISPRSFEDLELANRLPSFRSFINIVIATDLDVNAMICEIKSSGYEVIDEVYEDVKI